MGFRRKNDAETKFLYLLSLAKTASEITIIIGIFIAFITLLFVAGFF